MKSGRRSAAGRTPARPAVEAPGVIGDDKYSQLQQALEAAGIGLWDWDLGTDRVTMSANMRPLLGIGGDMGSSHAEFLQAIHPADRERVETALRRAIRRRGSFDEEFRVEAGDQAIHWMRIRGRATIRSGNRAERVMGSIHDKTERRMAYDALAAARAELEGKVRERTRELLDANERLRQEIAIKNNLQRQIMEISEKEQRRIGQDLHDSLSQQLGGILFMGQALQARLESGARGEARDAARLVGHLQNALTYTRDLARGLYPTLGAGGLGTALEELALAVTELFAVPVAVRCGRNVAMADETATIHAYRIVQEAVNNAIRHGQAKRIVIRLFRRQGAIVLTVADNGVGFPQKPNRKGMGLNIMRYRAASIGASFDIATERNRGTVVTCVFNRRGGSPRGRRGGT